MFFFSFIPPWTFSPDFPSRTFSQDISHSFSLQGSVFLSLSIGSFLNICSIKNATHPPSPPQRPTTIHAPPEYIPRHFLQDISLYITPTCFHIMDVVVFLPIYVSVSRPDIQNSVQFFFDGDSLPDSNITLQNISEE